MTSVATKPSYAAQIEGLIFALLLIDERGCVVEMNHAAENLLSRSAKRSTGKPFQDVVDVADARVIEHLDKLDAALVARNIGLLVDGQEKRVNVTFSPIAGNQGWRVVTLSEAGRDTENSGDMAAGEMIGAPAILAHEIKNPLAAIRAGAQLVSRRLPDEDQKLARMITSEVDRIASLIDRMQALGKTTPVEVAPCNPHEAIREAVGTVRTGNTGGVEIREEFDPSLPPVLASQESLEQVLINLISNACDAASDAESPLVTVRTRFVSGLVFSAVRLGRRVKLPIEITITDNGPGIPTNLRDHVFEPFVTSKKSGQGLGLALVRKLVRDMDGRIGYDRDERGGETHFRIHLPMASMKSAERFEA
ncbi:two-component system sensor histidine kinase NtrB [Erythrobacter sp. HA6-11]